jgi:hypothetical protein
MVANGPGYFPPVVCDINDIAAAFTSALARTNVHHRTAKERTLADAHAGVSDQTAPIEDQSEKIGRSHILEEMEMRRVLHLVESANTV